MQYRIPHPILVSCMILSTIITLSPIVSFGEAKPVDPFSNLTIMAEGQAYNIPYNYYYKGMYKSAVLSLTCAVTKITPGLAKFSVEDGFILVNGETYSVSSGKGHWGNNFKLQINVKVTSSEGDIFQLILHGTADGSPGPGTFEVSFSMPQSKLASKCFLYLDGEIVASE